MFTIDVVGVLYTSTEAGRPTRYCCTRLIGLCSDWNRSISPHPNWKPVLKACDPVTYDTLVANTFAMSGCRFNCGVQTTLQHAPAGAPLGATGEPTGAPVSSVRETSVGLTLGS